MQELSNVQDQHGSFNVNGHGQVSVATTVLTGTNACNLVEAPTLSLSILCLFPHFFFSLSLSLSLPLILSLFLQCLFVHLPPHMFNSYSCLIVCLFAATLTSVVILTIIFWSFHFLFVIYSFSNFLIVVRSSSVHLLSSVRFLFVFGSPIVFRSYFVFCSFPVHFLFIFLVLHLFPLVFRFSDRFLFVFCLLFIRLSYIFHVFSYIFDTSFIRLSYIFDTSFIRL